MAKKGNGNGQDDRHIHALWCTFDHAVPTNLNLRKEQHGDEQVSGIDLSLTAICPHTVLDQLEPGSAPIWRAALWDEDGNVRELGTGGPIPFKRKADGVHVELSVPSVTSAKGRKDAITLHSVKVHKFKAKPAAGTSVELAFQLQSDLDDPDATVPWLNRRYLDGAVNVTFQGFTQRDIDDEPPEVEASGADGEGARVYPDTLDGTSKSALGAAAR